MKFLSLSAYILTLTYLILWGVSFQLLYKVITSDITITE